MRILSVCGISKSGKTTTVEHIIKELIKRGYSVGSLKDIHFEGFKIDSEGTNTDKHKKAGANPVIARGLRETDVMFSKKLPIEELLQFYTQDFVVMEGVFEPGIPMILTAHDINGLDELDNPFVFAVSGKISGEIKEYKSRPAIDATKNIDSLVSLIEEKVFDRLPMIERECCGLCGFDCIALGERIISGRASPANCLLKNHVSLKIDGKEIEIAPFVQKILKNAVLGIACELRGYKKGHIELEFRNE